MISDPRFSNYSSYMMGTYVRYVQQMGARVVPIIREEPDEVTLEKLSKVNGVLMPGGDADYLAKGQFVFEQAKLINDGGKIFPIWGTCLGFENLIVYTASRGN